MKIRRKSDIILWARIDLLLQAQQQNGTIDATVGRVGMFLCPETFSSLSTKECHHRRIVLATFNGNPRTTIVSCKGSINCSPDEDKELFY